MSQGGAGRTDDMTIADKAMAAGMLITVIETICKTNGCLVFSRYLIVFIVSVAFVVWLLLPSFDCFVVRRSVVKVSSLEKYKTFFFPFTKSFVGY